MLIFIRHYNGNMMKMKITRRKSYTNAHKVIVSQRLHSSIAL